MPDTCPTCTSPVKIIGGDEGTFFYAPLDAATFNAELEAERRRADRAEEARENANAATLRAEADTREQKRHADAAFKEAERYRQLHLIDAARAAVAETALEELREWAESQANSYSAAGQGRAYRDVVRRIEEMS